MNDKTMRNQMLVGRRTAIANGSVLTATLLMPRLAFAEAKPAEQSTNGGATMKSVRFKNNGIDMAGNLYFPKGFTKDGKYAAIVSVHPGGGVKEQTAGVYAQRLAEQGFVALAFDASHQGASGGMPRFLDDPMRRVGDIYSAVD